MKVLTVEAILLIHDDVISDNELQGLAGSKSLQSVISRVENRIHYGLINDIYDLAATYAVVFGVGHVFNDANKRTAHSAMEICLELNNIMPDFPTEEIGNIMIKVAQGIINEVELARYLREHLS